jgi:hypothetical protein
MKQVYEYKKDSMDQNRVYGKRKDNIFQEVVGGMITIDLDAPPKKPAPRYKFQPPPADTGERLSTDDALAQLREMTGGKR